LLRVLFLWLGSMPAEAGAARLQVRLAGEAVPSPAMGSARAKGSLAP
jgi:hypothetical protein